MAERKNSPKDYQILEEIHNLPENKQELAIQYIKSLRNGGIECNEERHPYHPQ